MKKKFEQLQDGWIVHDKKTYEFFINSQPPRKPPLVKQFLTDLKSPMSLLLIISSGYYLFQGLMGSMNSFLTGAVLLSWYLFMYMSVFFNLRNTSIKCGTIKNIKKHSKMRSMSAAEAIADDGITYPVTFYDTAVDPALLVDNALEVLFPHNVNKEYNHAIAVRVK